MRNLFERVSKSKLGPGFSWIEAHPRLSAWIALSAVMVTLLIIEASNVGLRPFQWTFLILATLLIAWLCVWIISWDESD